MSDSDFVSMCGPCLIPDQLRAKSIWSLQKPPFYNGVFYLGVNFFLLLFPQSGLLSARVRFSFKFNSDHLLFFFFLPHPTQPPPLPSAEERNGGVYLVLVTKSYLQSLRDQRGFKHDVTVGCRHRRPSRRRTRRRTWRRTRRRTWRGLDRIE